MSRLQNARWPAALALSVAAPWAAAQGGPDAEALLSQMAAALAGADRMSVTMEVTYDAVQESGRQIEFAEVREVVVDRPSRLRVDLHESDGDRGGLIFDGKTVTQFNTTANVYSRLEQPGDVDETIRFSVGDLRVRMPLARMLLTTLPEDLQRTTTRVDWVETHVLGPEPLEHLAGQTDTVDFQVWLGKDHLPRRIVLTYPNAPGEPQTRVRFSDWNLAPRISNGAFTFKPPEEAEEIPTVRRAQGGSQ